MVERGVRGAHGEVRAHGGCKKSMAVERRKTGRVWWVNTGHLVVDGIEGCNLDVDNDVPGLKSLRFGFRCLTGHTHARSSTIVISISFHSHWIMYSDFHCGGDVQEITPRVQNLAPRLRPKPELALQQIRPICINYFVRRRINERWISIRVSNRCRIAAITHDILDLLLRSQMAQCVQPTLP